MPAPCTQIRSHPFQPAHSFMWFGCWPSVLAGRDMGRRAPVVTCSMPRAYPCGHVLHARGHAAARDGDTAARPVQAEAQTITAQTGATSAGKATYCTHGGLHQLVACARSSNMRPPSTGGLRQLASISWLATGPAQVHLVMGSPHEHSQHAHMNDADLRAFQLMPEHLLRHEFPLHALFFRRLF